MAEPGSALDRALGEVKERGLDPNSPGGAVALAHLLGASHPPSAAASAAVVPAASPPSAGERGEPAATLAQWAGVGRDEILDIFEFGEGPIGIGVSSRLLPPSKADRQRALVVLKLAAERVVGSRDVVPAGEINDIASHYDVLDQNLASNVAIKTNMVARRGKRGSWVYRVTQPGLDHAKDLITTLARGEDLSNS